MEISKSLQQEILAVQNKLKNAIRDHQACVMKLKDDPSNTDVLGRIHEIQLHIVSLGRCQKQVVQRLRKEVEAFKVENPNGVKITIAALLGVNNNNHITANQEERRNRDTDIAPKLSKQHYEEVVRNGNASPSLQDLVKGRSSSVETVSGEDDVIEVSNDENTSENQEEAEEDFIESPEKLGFLNNLGLITKDRLTEMQKKRTERKRRSTANPQFVYSSLEVPSKKKRYMQGNGSAPKTRQSKVKKGPSPPPPVKVVRPKSISPPTRANLKSLVPLQKTSGRPNILRNVTESKVFANKSKLENGTSQTQVPSAKTVQSTDRKTVHIPGLPSSLTIERIENDSIVCICCRNPGILTVCESCTSNFHVSCHSISPAPSRICPRCVGNVKNERLTCKKDEEFEEKERERYELRERNSDLRLQVYELEKRSQLLGQSLQQQQRTRQELLGKQERTQRSIKRLVDFIKLMQLRKSTASPPPSPSVSYHRPPISSQSPRTPSPPQPSTSHRQSHPQQPIISSSPKIVAAIAATTAIRIPTSSLISCPRQTSPISSKSPSPPTRSNCPSTADSRRNINHTSSSRRSQIQPENQQRSKAFQQTTITSCQPRQAATAPEHSPASPEHPCSSTSPSTQLDVHAGSPRIAPSPLSIASFPQKAPRMIISSSGPPTTAESLSNGRSSASISCDQPEQPRSFCLPTTPSQINWKQTPASPRRPEVSVISAIGQGRVVYSTHCSQAITSPIPSPIILTNHREPPSRILPTPCSNTAKATTWPSEQTNLQALSAGSSRSSSST
ncbi:serine/arginine repetitive matrix protein 1-like isoform X2 [Prorops nasuta]|uniref:serine/arginine repetitive matrix protein 1-like isoform X2 n=1 Tax=Prorops nasuta TaxID=863751 RepID=UPI0034CD916E